jgi:hypothetical protein
MNRNHDIRKRLAVFLMVFIVGISTSPMIRSLSIDEDMRFLQLFTDGLGYDDTTPPVTTLTIDPPEPIYDGWYRFVSVTLNATDNESGVNVTYYQVNDYGWEIYTHAFYISLNGIILVQFYSVDNAGNEETPKQMEIKIDSRPPTTVCFFDPPVPNGWNGWYVDELWLILNATDNESGVWRTYWNHQIYTEPIRLTESMHTITFYSIDNVNNREMEKTNPAIKIDMTKPTIKMTYNVTEEHPLQNRYELTFYVTANDATSGMDRCEFYLNGLLQETVTGPGPEYQWTWNFTELPNVIIRAIVYDVAGNDNFQDIVDPTNCENQQNQSQSQTAVEHIFDIIGIPRWGRNQHPVNMLFLFSFFIF